MDQRGTIVVTGATSGIGHATAVDLAQDFSVIALGRDPDRLAELAEVPGVVALAGDLSDAGTRADLARRFPDRLVGLVHSAAYGTPGLPEESDAGEWDRQLQLNVVAAAELTRLALPPLRAGHATVVFVNSGAGLRASAAMAVYAATKHALRAYADSLRAAEPELRVASVYPGRTATPMQVSLKDYEGAEYRARELLRPESVAAAIRFALTAPDDAHITDLSIRPRLEPR